MPNKRRRGTVCANQLILSYLFIEALFLFSNTILQASTLRYELAENREQCERIRRDKMAEVNQLEKDFSEKIVTLEKAIETQRAVIEFKVKKFQSKKKLTFF